MQSVNLSLCERLSGRNKVGTLTPPIVNIQKAGLKRQEAGDSTGAFGGGKSGIGRWYRHRTGQHLGGVLQNGCEDRPPA